MQDPSRMGTKPLRKQKPLSTSMQFFLTLIIGIFIGVILMGMVGFGLYIFEFVYLTGEAGPQPEATLSCPPTVDCASVYPTCEAATAEAVIQAITATAACAEFNARFPGTPCPPPATP